MAGEVALEPQASSVVRKQPLLSKSATNGCEKSRRSKAGVAAGECAAVCCCCPCTVVHIALLALYRAPKSLWAKKRRNLLERRNRAPSPEKERSSWRTMPVESGGEGLRLGWDAEEEYVGENDIFDWDKEMRERFPASGFFRSPSEGKTTSHEAVP